MNVLVGCEYSGTVGWEFLKRGHDVLTCDILPSECDDVPHFQGDIADILPTRYWGLIILHPPCTALCVAGNGTYAPSGVMSKERKDAIEWTKGLFRAACLYGDAVALENPVGVLSSTWRKPDQYIQPWQFGHPETKKTGLWLRGLPKLKPTDNVYDEMMKLPKKERHRIWYASPGEDRGKERSRFYRGIAKAMAEQWDV